mmetsp:Transcript_115328/g.321320  ORF Transcript_115328/g.321320 Transcript_115328/m.321320 type:complete len:204 (-) Transcript_115328:646-1257(-)
MAVAGRSSLSRWPAMAPLLLLLLRVRLRGGSGALKRGPGGKRGCVTTATAGAALARGIVATTPGGMAWPRRCQRSLANSPVSSSLPARKRSASAWASRSSPKTSLHGPSSESRCKHSAQEAQRAQSLLPRLRNSAWRRSRPWPRSGPELPKAAAAMHSRERCSQRRHSSSTSAKATCSGWSSTSMRHHSLQRCSCAETARSAS